MARSARYRSFVGRISLALVVLVCTATAALAEFKVEMVPMRDGVKLATNLFFPEGEGPWPVVLSRTPYGKGRAASREEKEKPYTERGYVRVVQDCRGRHDSEGEYRAFIDDMDDGYDTVEWIAAQPWSTGKVGMIGGSALGITANHAAMSGAPHLVCNVVFVSHGSSYHNSGYPGGVFLKNLNEEWLRKQGVPPADVPRPIHRVYDDSFRQRDIEHYFDKMQVPTINIGGWYDIFSQGNIDCFTGLQYRGGERARGNQKLIMGAIGHGQLRGDLKYPNPMYDFEELSLRWFDHWLKGEDNGVEDEPAVRYYLMGDTMDDDAPGNAWRTSDVWPPKATETAYYLHSGGRLSTQEPPKATNVADIAPESSDTFVYDPRNPVPTVGGNNLMMPLGPMDQREVSSRPDVLKYETEPLSEAVEIVGPVVAKLAVSTDVEDTDFMVKLIDVYPNGYEALMLDQAFRLRFREGFNRMVKAEPGQVYEIDVDLWSTALVFNQGHKIAVHISSSNSPRFEAHSNTWKPVSSMDDAVEARNTVHHSAAFPSRIVLPVTKVYDAPAEAGD
ncbi:MAG: CocE/NonD family hydrolase [Planctomycetota bacterium]|nr:MAG: CocE/NonD family hydrolase [Planctomycetota bacterium]